MHLYLVQHGLAVAEAEDPDRPLTREGRAETEAMARHLQRTGTAVDAIWHSGRTRARQTAELLRTHLNPKPVLETVHGLGPGDDPSAIASRVEGETQRVMLVGHLPHLAKLAALLLTGKTDLPVVQIRNSGVLYLFGDADRWTLRWYQTPDTLLHET